MLDLLGRIPGVVWLIGVLLGGAWIMTHAHVRAGTVVDQLSPLVGWLIALAVVAAPYLAALVGVLALIYVATHHHEHAVRAGISAVILGVLKLVFAWGWGPAALALFGIQVPSFG